MIFSLVHFSRQPYFVSATFSARTDSGPKNVTLLLEILDFVAILGGVVFAARFDFSNSRISFINHTPAKAFIFLFCIEWSSTNSVFQGLLLSSSKVHHFSFGPNWRPLCGSQMIVFMELQQSSFEILQMHMPFSKDAMCI